MTTLIIYDTLYGNTQKIAEAISEVFGAKAVRIQDFQDEMLKGVSLLIMGCPVHGWRPSRPASDFLASMPSGSLKGIKVAAFDTRIEGFFSGSASDKVDKKLVELGGESIVPPGKFIVKGKEGPLVDRELDKANGWAKHIIEGMNDNRIER